MVETLNKVSSYEGLLDWLDTFCEANNYSCWHKYGTSDFEKYKANNDKILVINSESGGYEDCRKVPPNEYMKWVKSRYKTPRYTSTFVKTIRYCIEYYGKHNEYPVFSKPLIQSFYKNTDILLETMEHCLYLNARITSNGTVSSREDKDNVTKDIDTFAPYRKRFCEVLRPKILVCCGQSGCDSFFHPKGLFPEKSYEYNRVDFIDGYIVITVKHMSRPQNFKGYKNLFELSLKASKLFYEKNYHL